MGKHTEGPWQVRHEVVIYSSDGLTVIGSAGTGNCHREDEIANAQLIAAAPDLLEALELADAALSGANMNMNVVDRKVKAAIARARGEE